jgi:ribonuclease VapC
MAAGFVLDASALICLLQGEHGADRVEAILDDAVISAVNLSEVIAKIVERGGTAEFAAAMLDPLRLDIVAFDEAQAIEAGRLRAVTRSSGLSFGDRACLALATVRGYTAVTADRAWAGLSWVSPQIELLRRSAQDPRP